MDQKQDPELQKKLQKKVMEAYLEQRKAEILRRYLDPAAYNRITNIKNANKNLYDNFSELIISFVNSGRLNRQLSEREVISILSKMSVRREPKIEIRRK